MAYTSPQVEGKIKHRDGWVCNHCNYNDNQANLTQCQYCGMLRFDPTQQSQIQPAFVPSQPYYPQPAPVQPQPSQIIPQQSQYPQQQYPAAPIYIQPQPSSVTTSVTVNVNNNNNYNNNDKNDILEKPFINEQYKPYYEEDVDNYKTYNCCCSFIRLFVWLTICGGLVMSLWWFIVGCIYCYWFPACFKIAKYLISGLCSKNNEIKLKTKCLCYDSKGTNAKNCCCDGFFIFIWMFIFGLPSMILHLVFGILSLPFFLFGFNFSIIHFRMVKIAFFNPHAVQINTKR